MSKNIGLFVEKVMSLSKQLNDFEHNKYNFVKTNKYIDFKKVIDGLTDDMKNTRTKCGYDVIDTINQEH